MKICCIGDVHGTDKFITGYNNILKKDNDCDKIIVFGDHFDPYIDITSDEMVEKYNEFIKASEHDNRIISLLGNHDLSSYIIQSDETSRTSKWNYKKFRNAILPNLSKSYLCYRINNYLFSHAGVSQVWMNELDDEFKQRILNNYTGWTEDELTKIVPFYIWDRTYYGDDPHQGCTWIRPQSLIENPFENYNQVVAHTRVKEISKMKMSNNKDLWMVDNSGNSDYLVLNIK